MPNAKVLVDGYEFNSIPAFKALPATWLPSPGLNSSGVNPEYLVNVTKFWTVA